MIFRKYAGLSAVLVCLSSIQIGQIVLASETDPSSNSGVAAQQSNAKSEYLEGWRMAAANPQRTGWVPEEVPGQLQLEWYKPFEPFISSKVQVIAADGSLFVATARGLYAIDANTGDEKWVYTTEMPLGHSPTVVGGVAYVGCFDRRVHAVDAKTGKRIWVSEPAGAGFNTNPVVIDGRVYAGNRDGSLYALDAKTGKKVWQFTTELQQPILYSCAHKDDVLYFACNDMHAYAIDAKTGEQIWKSEKLPGSGFHSWWPVVYGERVIFTGSSNFRGHGQPSTIGGFLFLEDQAIFGGNEKQSGWGGALAEDADVPWKSNADHPTLDFSKKSPEGNGPITEYYEARPWRRTYLLLDRATGKEITYDFDRDGKPEYAPLAYLGTHSGNRYPPIVGGDGLLYQTAGGVKGQTWISRGGIMRWKLDTPFVGVMSIEAHDEEQALAGGGNLIQYYHSEWRDGTQGSIDTRTGRTEAFYWYIDKIAPDIPEWVKRYPNYMHGGGGSNPPVPYRGRVYQLRWNHVICFSAGGGKRRLAVSIAPPTPAASSVPVVSREVLRARLAAEVEKMLQAGHLRTGWMNRGLCANWLSQVTTDNFDDYFSWPGETLEVLCRALPLVPEQMQPRVKAYLATEFEAFAPDVYAHIGWRGAAREIADIPPEYSLNIYGPQVYTSHRLKGSLYSFPPHANYAMYLYARVFGNAGELVKKIRSERTAPDATLIEYPWAHNAYIAGYAGIVGLKSLAGQTDPAAQAELERLQKLRADTFSKDRITPGRKQTLTSGDDQAISRMINELVPQTIARNFMYLTPELAAYLNAHALDKVREACREYDEVHPHWFVSKAEEGWGENIFNPLFDYHTLFQAKAMILQEPYAELVKYLDVPAYWRGDLYYIDNLCAALEAADRDSIIECGTGQAISDNVNVTAMVKEAVSEARAAYGKGYPKVILLAEQIDADGSVILPALQKEFGTDVPVCGVHILKSDYTPFTLDSFPKESDSYKSVAVMALGGGLAVQTVKADGILPMWDEPVPYDKAIQCGRDLAAQLKPSKTVNNLILIMGAQHNPGAQYLMKGVRQVLTGDQEGVLPANIRVIGWGTMDETDDVYFNSRRYFYRDLPDGSSVVAVMLTGNFNWAFSGQEQSGAPAGAEPYTGWANAVAEIPVHIHTVVTELGGVPDATFFIPAHPDVDEFAAIETAVEAQLGADASLFGWHAASETGHDRTDDGYSRGTAFHFFVAGIKGRSPK